MAEDSAARRGTIARIRGLLSSPQEEWMRVGVESAEGVLISYALPLATLAAAAGVGDHLLGAGIAFDAALVWRLAMAGLQIVVTLIALVIAGTLLDWLLRRFAVEAEPPRGRVLAVYSATPLLLALVGAVLPVIAPLLLLAGFAYSLVLLAMGVQTLAPVPEGKMTAFMSSFIGASLAAAIVSALVAAPLLREARDRSAERSVERAAATARSAMSAPSTPIALAVERLAQARVGAVDPARLQDQLPPSLPGGLSLSQASHNADGWRRAEGVYARAGATLTVTVAQVAEGGDHAPLVDLLSVRRQGAGYARTQQIDGRLYVEAVAPDWVKYGVLGRGVVIVAEGAGAVTIDDARAAVEIIGLQRLEREFGG